MDTFINANCVEPSTGWTGSLTADESTITAKLHRYKRDGTFRDSEDWVWLLASNAKYCTLINAHSGFGSTSSKDVSINFNNITANYIAVGHRRLERTDKITEFEFCLPGATHSLSYADHRETDIEADCDNQQESIIIQKLHTGKSDILDLVSGDVNVTISKKRIIGIISKDIEKEDLTWIHIKNKKPLSFEEIFKIPFNIEVFFSLSEGRPLPMRGIRIKTADSSSQADEDQYIDEFELYCATDRPTQRPDQSGSINSLFRVFSASDRTRTSNALRIWLDRRAKWAVAYWCAAQFIDGSGSATRSNLLRAMAWFEALPPYQTSSGIDETLLKKFRRDARKLQSFGALGIAPERFTQVLSELHRVSLSERMRSAIDDINRKLGGEHLHSSLETDCKLAKAIRDRVAHGGPAELEDDFRRVIVATSAIETLAFLATVIELGADPKHIQLLLNRFQPHPFASYASWSLSQPEQ